MKVKKKEKKKEKKKMKGKMKKKEEEEKKTEEHRYKRNGNKEVPINNNLKCKLIKSSNKRHRVHDPYTCCLQETDLRTKNLHRWKEKKWKINI